MLDNLSNLHNVLLIIADEIARICTKYQIPYAISSGTLLGAVRHKGFIPWDDDFDIEMKRKDYISFEKACKDELDSSKFFLQTENSEDFYPFSFAKLRLNGTEVIEDFSKDASVHHGIFVDIFILDNVPDNLYATKILLLKNLIIKNMLWVKCGYGTDQHKRKLRYYLFKIMSIPFSVENLKHIRDKIITKYNCWETKFVFCSDYPQFLCPIALYNNYKKYRFEDREYYGIYPHDEYLTFMYGDYMKLPPPEERRSHSNYEINFGSYI